jgi:hypothetical protein
MSLIDVRPLLVRGVFGLASCCGRNPIVFLPVVVRAVEPQALFVFRLHSSLARIARSRLTRGSYVLADSSGRCWSCLAKLHRLCINVACLWSCVQYEPQALGKKHSHNNLDTVGDLFPPALVSRVRFAHDRVISNFTYGFFWVSSEKEKDQGRMSQPMPSLNLSVLLHPAPVGVQVSHDDFSLCWGTLPFESRRLSFPIREDCGGRPGMGLL